MKINIHTHRPHPSERSICTAGVHPYDAASVTERQLIEVAEQAAEADAVGETGLDFVCDVDKELQESVLRYQLALAERLHKPVILHCVRAFEPLMKLLAEYELVAVIFHGFVGSPEQALRAVRCGYYLSFGHRTFASPRSLDALRQTPLDRLFVETDDNDITIEEVYERIAQALCVDVDRLEEAIGKNFETIFGTA